MIKEAIEKILSLANDAEVVVDTRSYWGKSGSPIIPPSVSPVASLTSLSALLSAIDAPELAGIEKQGLQIVVRNHREVVIVSAADCTWAKRDHYVSASWDGETFPFNRFMDIESFIIKAQCLFVDGYSDTKGAIIKFLSSVRGEEVVTNTDDGISQGVVVEDSMNRKSRSEFSPIVELAPYRTFPEVEQPASRFLLRMRKNNDKTPEVALFEADGGLWVSKACSNISAYLMADKRIADKGISVIG